MDQGLIPRRYAKALYEVSASDKEQTSMYDHMLKLEAAFAQEPKLQETVNNPFVSPADKRTLLSTAAGADSSDIQWANMLGLLEQNGRLGMARDIAKAYVRLYRQLRNIYSVEVVSAAPMGSAEQDRLKALIQKHLDGGSMEYSFRVDPELIGGFIVNIDNQRLDASVKNELKQLRLKLLSNK